MIGAWVDRPYQRECRDAIGSKFMQGIWSQIVVLPTGCGKTEIFTRLRQSPLASWLESFAPQQQKTLVLAHRDELIEQAVKKFRRANPDLNIGIEKAERRSSWMDDVVVASVQTLKGKRLAQLDPDPFRIVITDEAHHAVADSYQDIFRHFGLLPPAELKPAKKQQDYSQARAAYQAWWAEAKPNRLLLGVTATPERGDAIGLEWTFSTVAYEKTLRWMIEQGYLAPLRGLLIDTKLSLDGVKMTAGDFNTLQLAQAVNTPERNYAAILAWQQACAGRKTLGFTVDIQHAKDLARCALAYGVRGAEWISGDDPLRADKLARFEAGGIPLLFNCNLLTEGFDLPDVSAILMARPTTSQALYMQMIGRGTRLAPGKQDCLVLDVVDASKRHSLVMLGDLFGLPAKFDLRGKDALKTQQEIETLQAQYPQLSLSGTTIEAIRKALTQVDLWAVRESATVAQLAKLRWIEDSPSRFHLPIPKQGESGGLETSFGAQAAVVERLEIREEMLGSWRVWQLAGADRLDLAAADTLAEAFLKAERWVGMTRPWVARMKAKDAPWMTRKPSGKQLALLRRLRASFNPETITRGEASAMIDQFMARKKTG